MNTHWTRAGLRALLMARRPFIALPCRDGQVMDGGMAALAEVAGRAPLPRSIASLREAYAQAPGLVGLRPDPRVRTQDGEAAGVPVRRYLPPGGAGRLLVYYHGGGFIMGGLDSHDALCRTIAHRAQVEVAAVDYRLAPEHPFPAAVEDAIAAYRVLRQGWPGMVAVGGDSAGANLAAVVCQACRDLPPALQWLLYPVVDMVEEGYPSLALFADQFPLTREGIDLCGQLYLPAGQDPRVQRLSPVRGRLDDLPPAIVVMAGFDPLRDHAAAYATAIRQAGGHARLCAELQLVHGFADFAGMVPAARRAVWRAAEALRDGMGIGK